MLKTFQLSWEGMSEASEPVNVANEWRKQSAAEKMNKVSGASEQRKRATECPVKTRLFET